MRIFIKFILMLSITTIIFNLFGNPDFDMKSFFFFFVFFQILLTWRKWKHDLEGFFKDPFNKMVSQIKF
jgi:hypothetical protein